MRKKVYNLGKNMSHDIQIVAKVEYQFSEREHGGKKYEARHDVHILADIRLSSGTYMHSDDCDLIERARAVYDSLRYGYENYPDGEVTVEMTISDRCCNF